MQTNVTRGSCKTRRQPQWHGHPAHDLWARRPCHEGFCKSLSILISIFFFTGCNSYYPELNGVYLENKIATLALARNQGLTNNIEAWFTNPPLQLAISNDSVYKTYGFDVGGKIIWSNKVVISKKKMNEYNIFYRINGRTVYVIVDTNGMWMRIPESKYLFRYDKIQGQFAKDETSQGKTE